MSYIRVCVSVCADNLSEHLLHIRRVDSTSRARADIERSSYPVTTRVEASSTTQLARALRRTFGNEHHRRYGCYCH